MDIGVLSYSRLLKWKARELSGQEKPFRFKERLERTSMEQR
jgi:hypothetical protein